MKVVVAGASGLIGQPLVRRLRADGHEVVQLVRREPQGTGEVRWDPARGELDVAALAGTDAAVNLAGAGIADKRWNEDYKRLLLSSRVDTTRTLATALAGLDPLPRVLVNASGINYYAESDDVLTESSPAGDGVLAGVVKGWEAAALPAEEAGIRVAYARSGLVMTAHGGTFGRLLPLFRCCLGGPLAGGRGWWSWITLEDEVAALRFLLDHDVAGPVNLTAPDPVRNAELTKELGSAVHRPALLPVPRFALRAVLGEAADDIFDSLRVVPEKLLAAGFSFRHPDLDSALGWLVRR